MLIGIGLGPGDPGLLTLEAVETLKRSNIVFVPGRLAAKLVEPYAQPHLLEFPMTKDRKVLHSHWEENAKIVAEHARTGLVSFGIIGDPNFFSTFTYLRRIIEERYNDITIKTIPGISSITAFASRSDVQLDRSFLVSDGTPACDSIILKAKRPRQIIRNLQSEGFDQFIFVTKLYSEEEQIITDPDDIPEKGDYFSMIYARKKSDNKK